MLLSELINGGSVVAGNVDIRGLTADSREVRPGYLFAALRGDLGEPDLVVYNAGAFMRQGILEASAEDFERCWRVGGLGAFLVGREAAKGMAARGSGTIIFTGATASLRGRAARRASASRIRSPARP